MLTFNQNSFRKLKYLNSLFLKMYMYDKSLWNGLTNNLFILKNHDLFVDLPYTYIWYMHIKEHQGKEISQIVHEYSWIIS